MLKSKLHIMVAYNNHLRISMTDMMFLGSYTAIALATHTLLDITPYARISVKK